MKKTLFLYFIIINYLFSSYLIVSSNIISGEEENIIRLEPFIANFPTLNVSTQNSFIEVPIYVKSNTTEAITLELKNIEPLKQNGETIPISFSYRGVDINNNTPFLLLQNGEGGRDGSTIVGKIKINIPNITDTQTYGTYNSNINMELSSTNYSNSATNILDITAHISLVAIAGFNSVSSYQNGKEFIGTTIKYGNLDISKKNSIEKELFIKSNSYQNFSISFNSSELINTIDNRYKIPINYYYNDIPFTDNRSFVALHGKNSGEISVGSIKFETDIVKNSILAGEYRATVGVTITLE